MAFAPYNHFLSELTLIPAAGWEIVLNSFDLAGWMNNDYANQTVRLLDATFNPIVDEFAPPVLMSIPH